MTRSNVSLRARSIAQIASFAFATYVATAITTSSTASAQQSQPSQDSALATTLFNDAKSLLNDGKVSEACRKLEESYRLDPLAGTILNLAVCHEKEGLLATAANEYRDARAFAERDHRLDRVSFVDERMKALAPKISQLVVVVPNDVANFADFHVTRDGKPLERDMWSTRIAVDPGDHTIEASAANKKPMHRVVTVGAEADLKTVLVELESDQATAAPPPIEPSPPPLPPTSPNILITPPPPVSGGDDSLSTRKTVAIVVAGFGVVGLGVGTFFGVRTVNKHNDPGATCTTAPCSSQSISLNEQAKFAADASTVSFAVGAVALATAAILWFTEPKH